MNIYIMRAVQRLRAHARQWRLAGGKNTLCTAVLGSTLLAASAAHAGFSNGGFEDNNALPPTGWTLKTYSRSAQLPASPPPERPTLAQLGLSGEAVGNGVSALVNLPITNVPATNPGTLTAPRWGTRAFKLNDQGARQASSIEQTATMTTADIDPIDNKIHLRFAMAPVLVDGGHTAEQQPYFYVEVYNITKSKVMFSTYNYANQSGVPWQTQGSYRYTDWQGFDVAPGNGQLDVGDQVKLIVYASNCSPGAADHEARVYLDAVGAFMPGLAVNATGPSITKPGEQVTYTYDYVNNSGVIALGSKVRVAAPKTENGLFTTFVPGSWPASCTGPHAGESPRSDYLECEVGDGGMLNDGQGGRFDVSYTVPATADTTGANAVVNNGDYDVRSSTASPFIGPLVKTNIVATATPVADLGVSIDNSGATSYAPGDTPSYTVTVTNHGASDVSGASVVQTLTGVSGGNWVCAVPAGSGATCGATAAGAGAISSNTADLPAGQSLIYHYTGGAVVDGTPARTVVTVNPPIGTQDTNTANNVAGVSVSVGAQRSVTAKATGVGAGHVLAVPAPLSCGNAGMACDATGVTKTVAESDEVRLTPVAHAGSLFKQWTGCSSVSGNVCVIEPGASVATAVAEFVVAHVVTPTVYTGGTVNPVGPVQVETGQGTVYAITPGAGKTTHILPPPSGAACTGTLDTGMNPNTYTIAAMASDCGFSVAFTVDITSSVVGGNGTITPLGVTAGLTPGSNSTVYTLAPNAGYTPVLGGTCRGTQDVALNTYTVTNALQDCTVIASFTNDPVTVTSSVAGAGGALDVVGTVTMVKGGARTYTLTPDAGYFPVITGNCPGTLVGNTYTVSPVNADCAFSASFTTASVDITSSVTSGAGTLSPLGVRTVGMGSGGTYTATPDAGQTAIFSGTCPSTRSGDTLTVSDARSDCTVQTKFIATAAALTVTVSVPGGGGTAATPGATAGGTLALAPGDTPVWTLTPSTAGMLPSVVAGSTCTGTLSATAPYTFTLTAPVASCTLAFAFAAAPVAATSIPTLSEWGLLILSGLMALGLVAVRRRSAH